MKTISFIELCELIKEGNAPREIIIGEEVFRRKFIYDEDLGYLGKDKDYIMGFYSLEKILQEPIQIPTEPLKKGTVDSLELYETLKETIEINIMLKDKEK